MRRYILAGGDRKPSEVGFPPGCPPSHVSPDRRTDFINQIDARENLQICLVMTIRNVRVFGRFELPALVSPCLQGSATTGLYIVHSHNLVRAPRVELRWIIQHVSVKEIERARALAN